MKDGDNDGKNIGAGIIAPVLALILLFVPSAPGRAQDREMGISQALRIALRDNPGVAAAAWGEAAAKSRLGEARSLFLPQITASAGYTLYQEPMTVTPIHRVGSFPPFDDRIYDAGIQLALPVASGRLLAGIGAARGGLAEAAAAAHRVRLDTMVKTTGIYMAALELADRTSLLSAHIGALEERIRELTSLTEEGRAAEADLALALASLETARADEADLRQGRRELSIGLGALLGQDGPVRPKIPGLDRAPLDPGPRSPADPTPPSPGASAPPSPGASAPPSPGASTPPSPGAAPSTGPTGRNETADPRDTTEGPAARMARARMESAEYGEKAVRRSLWPDLTVFAGKSWRAGSDRDFSGEWAAGLSLRIPLLDYPRRAASISAAEAGSAAARSRYQEARIAEASGAEALAARMEGLHSREEILGRAVDAKASSVAAFRERYAEGRLPLSELLTGEAELLQLRIRQRSALYQRTSTFFEYHALRGSLSEPLILSVLEE